MKKTWDVVLLEKKRIKTITEVLLFLLTFQISKFLWRTLYVGEVGLLLASSNSHPSHRPYSCPLDSLLSSNSDHPPNPTNPGGGLKFVDLHPLESKYINRKRRTKVLLEGAGYETGRHIFQEPNFWPS